MLAMVPLLRVTPDLTTALSDDLHRARVGSALAGVLHEPDTGSELQAVERAVENGVAMEVELLAFRGTQESVAFVREELRDGAMARSLVGFFVAALTLHEVLKTPARVVERGIDGGIDILVGSVRIGSAFDHYVATGKSQVDSYAVVFPVMGMAMRQLERDATGRNPPGEDVELLRSPANILLDGVRVLHSVEGDLEGDLHDDRVSSKGHALARGRPFRALTEK
jgi:hypothetical protein